MKIADLLRNLADVVDNEMQSQQPSAVVVDKIAAQPQHFVQSATNTNDEGDLAPQRMVPPLQLKLELLKRAVDVNNIYSPDVPDQDGRVPPHRLSLSRTGEDESEQENDVVPEPEDEMSQLRRRISALLQVDAGGDGPLDD